MLNNWTILSLLYFFSFNLLICKSHTQFLIQWLLQAIPKEAEEFELGKSKYYMILALAALGLQFMAIGSLGLIFCSSSLFGGIVTALLVPVQQAFAVIFLPESFSPEKGMALAMCLWGFASYFYGEYKLSHKKLDATQELEKEVVVWVSLFGCVNCLIMYTYVHFLHMNYRFLQL